MLSKKERIDREVQLWAPMFRGSTLIAECEPGSGSTYWAALAPGDRRAHSAEETRTFGPIR
jgi:hypothetical protein